MKIIYIDPEKCVSCHSCEISCAEAHSSTKHLPEALNESPQPEKRIRIIGSKEINLPVQCRHCTEALCVEICPKGALKKEGDLVLYNEELCIGCRFCIQACPFGVIKFIPERKKIVKCDQCVERLKNGDDPACVYVCPTDALTYIEADTVKETSFIKNNADNIYLYPVEKVNISRPDSMGSGERTEKDGICKLCAKPMKPNKKLEEVKSKVKNKALLEYLAYCPECRSEVILRKIKIKSKVIEVPVESN